MSFFSMFGSKAPVVPPTPPPIFTHPNAPALLNTRTLVSLGFVGTLVLGAYLLKLALLPPHLNRSTKWRFIFCWLAFDGLCHLILEGSFLYLSTFGRTVGASSSFFAYMWQDYSRADLRWGIAEPTVVSLEILTVLGGGPLALYCAYLLAKEDARYHYWVVVLSTAELYGGFMTFCPEWLTGNKGLNGSNWVLLYVYLWFMNMIWVVIPAYLMVDSYRFIARAVKSTAASTSGAVAKKTKKSK
ncbi:unnamed protein product [Tilletia laevis]|uniref:Uncharacterized protein n=3 Tax=Tilletia TaxID=13289 RepID=A0A9N8L8A5_9BASI|nr:unnamed protein product [Tilletia caries]CAD6902361.1 unnamed protein product [Tilletia laevis]CAD6905497.1 unnamed protein product [Tilletia laevis]CAD6944995.1 unnamed protein product [Tilletia caries]CAD6963913.1 unnamed protein product [Tilletia caries]